MLRSTSDWDISKLLAEGEVSGLDFQPIPCMDSACGVYVLLLETTVTYIGQSLNVPHRIWKHQDNLDRGNRGLPARVGNRAIPFTRAIFAVVPKDKLDEAEQSLIEKFQPIFNIQRGGRKIGCFNLDRGVA